MDYAETTILNFVVFIVFFMFKACFMGAFIVIPITCHEHIAMLIPLVYIGKAQILIESAIIAIEKKQCVQTPLKLSPYKKHVFVAMEDSLVWAVVTTSLMIILVDNVDMDKYCNSCSNTNETLNLAILISYSIILLLYLGLKLLLIKLFCVNNTTYGDNNNSKIFTFVSLSYFIQTITSYAQIMALFILIDVACFTVIVLFSIIYFICVLPLRKQCIRTYYKINKYFAKHKETVSKEDDISLVGGYLISLEVILVCYLLAAQFTYSSATSVNTNLNIAISVILGVSVVLHSFWMLKLAVVRYRRSHSTAL